MAKGPDEESFRDRKRYSPFHHLHWWRWISDRYQMKSKVDYFLDDIFRWPPTCACPTDPFRGNARPKGTMYTCYMIQSEVIICRMFSRWTLYFNVWMFALYFYYYKNLLYLFYFYDLSAWGGCWFVVYIRRFIYKFLNVCPFD